MTSGFFTLRKEWRRNRKCIPRATGTSHSPAGGKAEMASFSVSPAGENWKWAPGVIST
jgi:hypothetical protein